MNLPKYLLAALTVPFTLGSATAADFNLTFEDTSAGINWSGVVDTTTDTLSITQWSAPGGNEDNQYADPTSLPMIFNAVTGLNDRYDIPDDWDGNLNNWGFLSEAAWTDYTWTSEAYVRKGYTPTYSVENATKLGLGVAETYVETVEDKPEGEEGKPVVIPAYFDRTYSNSATFTDTSNSERVLTATTFTVTPVPEPSSTALLGLGALSLLLRRSR